MSWADALVIATPFVVAVVARIAWVIGTRRAEAREKREFYERFLECGEWRK